MRTATPGKLSENKTFGGPSRKEAPGKLLPDLKDAVEGKSVFPELYASLGS